MNKKILTTGLVIVVPIFNVWAEPGGTYTLTGKEKGIAEIIEADMAQYPELYQGESLNGYISRFKRENKIGKRKISPGDQLLFPETLASIKAKKAKAEEKRNQKKSPEPDLYASFIKRLESDWTEDSKFRELLSKLDRKGFWEDHWVTELDGRYENGQIEYKIKSEPSPSDGVRYQFRWVYCHDKESFEKEKKTYQHLAMVHEQSFTLPDGAELYQGVWQMVDD